MVESCLKLMMTKLVSHIVISRSVHIGSVLHFLFSTEIVLVRCTNTQDSNTQRLLKYIMKTRRCMTDIYNAGQTPDA